MPYREWILGRMYWKIGEAAKEIDVPVSKVRFWEDEFGPIFRKRKKTKGVKHRGIRLYDRNGINKLKKIKNLKDEGYTLAGIKRRL